MKKIIFIISLLFVLFSINQNVQASDQVRRGGLRVTPRNIEGLNKTIDFRRDNFIKEMAGMDEIKSKIYENQNRLRGGAQNLMIMENMIGDNGEKVAIIAEDLNESAKNTLQFEEDFSERSGFKKFLFGQKKNIVKDFSEEIKNNEERIIELKELMNKSEVSLELRNILDEQFNNIKEEHGRMNMYFQEETKRKGILTWLINIFN